MAGFLREFPRLSIGLVGDLFLDRYLDIDPACHELSVETGLEAYQVGRVRNNPGALGTVLNNLAALGVGTLRPLTVIGDDGEACDVLRCLQNLSVVTANVIQDAGRQTPTYTKPMQRDDAGTWRELNRLDLRTRAPLSSKTESQVIARLRSLFEEVDGLIVLDQVREEGWGVVTPRVRDELAALAADRPEKFILADSRAHVGAFRGCVLKPNRSECERAAAPSSVRAAEASPEVAAFRLARRANRHVYCTLGEAGMLLVDPQGDATRIASYPVRGPIDIVGAGDSATSGLVASYLAGANLVEAGQVGNLVASITIQQIGTTGTATPEQVLARWDETHTALAGGYDGPLP
ncbi:MAG: carbohydrate kinase [Planctomycetia bacterium]|nr:carbohydrate kinase [Planctomycetia bacterium]